MTHASLFSGIGGFDLAASWLGWENLFQVEIDPYCRAVLQKHFPNTHRHDDVTTFDGRPYTGRVDVLSGGFPCQPFSLSGQRKGTSDDRHLWPEMLRITDQIRPRYLVAENVGGFVSMAEPTNVIEMEDAAYYYVWFEKVAAKLIRDLAQIGYSVAQTDQGQPILCIIPACAVGAIHQRDRIWIVAYSNSIGQLQRQRTEPNQSGRTRDGHTSNDTNAGGLRQQIGRHGPIQEQIPTLRGKEETDNGDGSGRHYQQVARQPDNTTDLLRAAYGVSDRLDGTGDLSGQPAHKKAAGRRHRIKALGNAIVPQIAYNIFSLIQQIEYETHLSNT